jgi:uncharacterized membrane protein
MHYLLWKLVHIVSVIMFMGNIVTGLFWAARAHKARDFRLIATTFEGIIRSDRWFTMPGVFGIIIGGFASAGLGKFPVLGTGWILWSIVLFSISGIIFGVRIVPLQRKITAFARGADSSDAAWARYAAMYRKWEMWGLLAMLTPAAAVVIMVLKPSLPGM